MDIFRDFEPIHVITRAQLLDAGELVDPEQVAPRLAHEAGFTAPVAFTRAAWEQAVAWEGEHHGQSMTGRLWDVYQVARRSVRSCRAGTSRVDFTVLRIPADATSAEPAPVTLSLHIGPGDHGEPVLTVLLPHED